MRHYVDENIKIKRYGQVFSGNRVGDLLVSMLPSNLAVKTIIDPMVGQGDLLAAAYRKFPKADTVIGIDIDEDVKEKCETIIPEAKILIQDAFKSSEVDILDGWDLVITNPPYIRYQTLKNNPEIGLPDGKEIRGNLIKHIKKSKLLDNQERTLYLEVSNRYSGLSDMAVPSWILCASLVKKSGYMAMVVPETWLSRDYAFPIHYLLLRCFQIVAIAHDVESAWFENAEIRTCLIICRRKDNEAIDNYYSDTVMLELGSEIINQESLVGGLKHDEMDGYDALNQIIYTQSSLSLNGFSSRVIPALDLFHGLRGMMNSLKWVYPEDKVIANDTANLPNELKKIVSKGTAIEYDSLETLGWKIGQGLRTGANDFFYAKQETEDAMSIVQTESWYGRKITLSSENVRRSFKKRSDVRGLVVNYDDLDKCIFYIQHQVRQIDIPRLSKAVAANYTLMDADLDEYITQGERYISPSHKKTFRELSAVVTNEKRVGDEYERFWYMLPPLKERHIPSLCISRVCGDSPETIFINQVSGKEIVVDANFITLWNPNSNDQILAFVLLNSTWAKLFLETIATPMGGGALKVEASHVRKIIFPRINDTEKKELEDIGKTILEKKEISRENQKRIDEIIISPYGEENTILIEKLLEELLIKKMKERTGRKI